METAPDQAGLIAFVVPLVASPALIDLSARTESDYGLDATSAPIFHVLPIPDVKLHLWGVPADHSHDPARFFSPLEGFGVVLQPLPGTVRERHRRQSSLPPVPYLENPTQCGVPLTTTVDVEYYSGNTLTRGGSVALDDRLRPARVQPEPHRDPDHHPAARPAERDGPGRRRVRPRRRPHRAADPEPDHPLAVGDPRDHRHPARRLLDQPERGRRQGHLQRLSRGPSAPVNGATCPEHSKVGTVELDSSALPQPIPGAIYLGDPQPGQQVPDLPHGRWVRHPREARRLGRTRIRRRDRSRSPSPTCRSRRSRSSTSTSSARSGACSRRRPSAAHTRWKPNSCRGTKT